ncbi:MAG: hypothetical protein ACXABU_13935 [Candidatus Hodarchaeales archaeon]
MRKIPIFFLLIILGINLTTIIQSRPTLSFAQGSRYEYAVLCTDYCGSKTWDATNLDANLFFYIRSIDEINDEISVYTRYNSTPTIEKPDDPDYGIFSLNESYSYSSRESKTEFGKCLWQWSFLETEFNVSIPYFFLAHAHSAFENNTFLLQKSTEQEEIAIDSQNTFQAISYHGVWNNRYNISNLMVTDEATLASTYDSESGILLRMEVEMISPQESIGPISQEINVDAVGSFKISLILPLHHTSEFFPFILGVFTLIITVRETRKRK